MLFVFMLMGRLQPLNCARACDPRRKSVSLFEEMSVIRHIVMWNLAGDTPQAKQRNIEQLKQSFLRLKEEIPGLRHLEIGVDTSHVDYACDVVLYSEFDSQAALDAYATHPAHLRVKSEIGGMRIARHQVDYAVSDF